MFRMFTLDMRRHVLLGSKYFDTKSTRILVSVVNMLGLYMTYNIHTQLGSVMALGTDIETCIVFDNHS